MKYSYILFSTLLVSQSALSQNEVNITLQNGKIDNFQTANLNSIEFNQDQITVKAKLNSRRLLKEISQSVKQRDGLNLLMQNGPL